MASILIAVRNQNGNALTSIEGTAFIALLGKNGQIISQQTVSMRFADAYFTDLAVGDYTAIVRHPEVEPTEATYQVTLSSEDEELRVMFFYSEPERVVLRVRTGL